MVEKTVIKVPESAGGPEKTNPLDGIIPPLRTDIQLIPAPDDASGNQMYQIYDPVRRKYFLIEWAEGEIIKLMKPGMTFRDLIQKTKNRLGVDVSFESLQLFFLQAEKFHFIDTVRSTEELMKESDREKQTVFQWLMIHYLYFRVPLFRPEHFLKNTLPYVSFLVSRPALYIYGIAFFGALLVLVRHFDIYIHTISYFFTFQGAVSYAVALAGVKVIHELAHAYTATYYGVRVPTIGVALLVMWPVLYTDVTDSWRLTDRKARLLISSAGIIAEMVIAGFATCLWAVTEPGILNSVFFILSSATLLTTLATNANPAMRYDGYYILSDLWGIDNLQQKSFALARWQLRKWFLGLDMPPPEVCSPRQQRSLIAYAIYTWIYRLILYTAVAFFVYYKFTKVLGIFLFFLEIYLFILKPLVDEAKELWGLRSEFKWNSRLLATLLFMSIAVLWFVIPLPHRLHFPSIVSPINQQIVFSPSSGVIEAIYVKRGQKVKEGDPVISLKSHELDAQVKSLVEEKKAYEEDLRAANFGENLAPLIPEKDEQLKSAIEKINHLENVQHSLVETAKISGTVYDWNQDLKVGQPLKDDQILGKIADLSSVDVIFFIPEANLNDIENGMTGTFMSKHLKKSLPIKIYRILPQREVELSFLQLSSVASGDLPVVKDPTTQKYRLVQSYFLGFARIDDEQSESYIGQIGNLYVEGESRSLLTQYARWLLQIVWKEKSL